MMRKYKEVDQETYYKEAFRVFFKDESGCVPAEEVKFVLRHLHVKSLSFFLKIDFIIINSFCHHPFIILIVLYPSSIFVILFTFCFADQISRN